MKHSVKIDVVSDVVCPWCYIGKRRLEKAIENMGEDFEFEVEYHPFELNPNVPAEGINQKQYLIEKFGGEDHYHNLTDRVAEIAASEGITLDYESQKISPNTRKSHALIRFARSKNLQRELVEILFNAYFTSGIDLSKDENLINAAVEAGLDAEEARSVIADEGLLADVLNEEQEIGRLGITGVPFYIINQKYGISGAQTPEMFQKAFKEICNYPLLMGEVCDVEKKNC